MSRPVRVGTIIRRLATHLEQERENALAEPADDFGWQAGFCEGLKHAQYVIRNGG